MDIQMQRGENPFDEPRRKLREADPASVAQRAGARWEPAGSEAGRIVLPVLSGVAFISFPDVEVEAQRPIGTFTLKLLSLLYLANTDGEPPSGEWLAYRELPGARFYEPVVRRSVEEPLAARFGRDREGFLQSCQALGGTEVDFGDVACSFALFPQVMVAVILWLCDEEFPPRAQLLFDSNSTHHLNAFDLRMGAQDISSLMMKAAGEKG
jgi:hypothetical protein